MKHGASTIVMCLIAVIVSGMILAAQASAEVPMKYLFLFAGSGSVTAGTFTAKGGVAEFKAKESTVECASSTDSGTFTNAHLGKITVVLEKCKTSSFNCGNEGSNEKLILKNWEWHLVAAFDSETKTWGPGVLLLIPGKEFSFTCAGIVHVKIVGTGIVGGLFKTGTTEALPLDESRSSIDLDFQGEKGASPIKLLYSATFFPLTEEEIGELKIEIETNLTKKLEAGEFTWKNTIEGFRNSGEITEELELVE
jgi:hypothetical protein